MIAHKMPALFVMFEANNGLCDFQWNLKNKINPSVITTFGYLGSFHCLLDCWKRFGQFAINGKTFWPVFTLM